MRITLTKAPPFRHRRTGHPQIPSQRPGHPPTYVYNAEGGRVLKTTGGVTTEYYHDFSGNVLGEAQGTTVTANYIRLGDQFLAEYTNGKTYFVHQDHLGSTRLMTDVSGCVVDSLDYLPFGERNFVGSTACTAADTTHKFTGYERDAETGLDDAQARYNSSQYGRFMTPDPENAGADPTNPQSWNMYSYALNNPLAYIDPTGTDACYWDEGDQSDPEDQLGTQGACEAAGANWIPTLNQQITVNANDSSNPDTSSASNDSLLSRFTLGVRVPGQTYKACMVANAKNYSVGGVADLTDLTLGTDVGTSTAGQFIAGNTFGSLFAAFAGSSSDAGSSMAGAAPGVIQAGMGAGLTYGRRTADIMALNLAGKGGLPQALSSASNGAKSLLGSTSKALSLGLEAAEKAAVDAGLFGAEAIGCSIPQ